MGIFAAIWYGFGTVGPRARQWRGAALSCEDFELLVS